MMILNIIMIALVALIMVMLSIKCNRNIETFDFLAKSYSGGAPDGGRQYPDHHGIAL